MVTRPASDISPNGSSVQLESQKPLVLVVDDDFDTGEVLQLALSPHFIVRVAHSADHALDVIAARTPDVILLDYFIPGNLGSSDLVAVLQSRRLSSRIVLLTGVGDPTEKATLLKIEYAIQKPFDIDHLVKLLTRLTA